MLRRRIAHHILKFGKKISLFQRYLTSLIPIRKKLVKETCRGAFVNWFLVAHLQIKDKIQQHEVDRTDRKAGWNANGSIKGV